MSLDQEPDNILAAWMPREMRELEANSSRLDEIARVHRRLPFALHEVNRIGDIVSAWKKQGRYVDVLPPGARSLQDIEVSHFEEAVVEGFLSIRAFDLGAELLLVKVDAGRGLFGQKVHYACFYGSDGSYHPVGTTKSLAVALSKLGQLYRL